MFPVQAHDLRHGNADRGGAADDRSRASADDEIEAEAKIEWAASCPPGMLVEEPVEERRGVDPARSAAIEAQHAIGPLRVILPIFSHRIAPAASQSDLRDVKNNDNQIGNAATAQDSNFVDFGRVKVFDFQLGMIHYPRMREMVHGG
jgi:hypothetical protein